MKNKSTCWVCGKTNTEKLTIHSTSIINNDTIVIQNIRVQSDFTKSEPRRKEQNKIINNKN